MQTDMSGKLVTLTQEQRDRLAALGTPHRSGEDIRVLEPTKVPWIVDGFVPRNLVTVLSGEGGVGKGWVSYYMALAVSNGLDFFSHATDQGPVLVWDLENRPADDIRPRLDGMCKWLACGCENIVVPDISEANVRLSTSTGLKLLEAHCDIYRPSLVIIDSLTDFVEGAIMDSNELMTDLINSISRVVRSRDAACLVIHHWNKGGQGMDYGDRMRGASAIRDSARSHLAVTRHYKSGNVTITHEKSNCGKRCEPIVFSIEDGEEGLIRLAIRQPDESKEAAKPRKPTKEEIRRDKILQVLSSRSMRQADLARATDIPKTTLQKSISKLLEESLIAADDGVYSLAA